MEAGTFGTCEVCGEPIALTQLSAFPRSTTCVTCRPRTPAPA
ncbi:TraR/DksA family transcriptional regulator [Segeticoccus sp.]